MPTVLRVDGYRFFFYSNEGNEPPHIHVERAGAAAKWWLLPVRLAWNDGFSRQQVRRIRTILHEHHAAILDAWKRHFRA